MAAEIKFIEFLQRLQRLPKESEEFARLLQAISDGRIDIDSQTRSFLAESCRALQTLSGDTGVADITEAVFCLILYKDDEEFALLGCTVSPGFDFHDFVLAKQEELTPMFPQHEKIIAELTHR